MGEEIAGVYVEVDDSVVVSVSVVEFDINVGDGGSVSVGRSGELFVVVVLSFAIVDCVSVEFLTYSREYNWLRIGYGVV